ncbi:MAG: type II toxin-antitoxin system HicB family antitoxin [Burkholderiaceae bacterium]|jgi:predicted HicB family RNase H-like nuclease|nr:type II toxin-antitoxin system HicB family antitoxin [Burkholderiaceae bacterium]
MSILTYRGYQGSFEYDHESDLFHGDVLHIADVITFQGRSIDELKASLAESIEVYLEHCARKGRTPEKPFSGTFNVRISPEVHQRIAMRAANDGVSLNKWVAKTLEKAVMEHV